MRAWSKIYFTCHSEKLWSFCEKGWFFSFFAKLNIQWINFWSWCSFFGWGIVRELNKFKKIVYHVAYFIKNYVAVLPAFDSNEEKWIKMNMMRRKRSDFVLIWVEFHLYTLLAPLPLYWRRSERRSHYFIQFIEFF